MGRIITKRNWTWNSAFRGLCMLPFNKQSLLLYQKPVRHSHAWRTTNVRVTYIYTENAQNGSHQSTRDRKDTKENAHANTCQKAWYDLWGLRLQTTPDVLRAARMSRTALSSSHTQLWECAWIDGSWVHDQTDDKGIELCTSDNTSTL